MLPYTTLPSLVHARVLASVIAADSAMSAVLRSLPLWFRSQIVSGVLKRSRHDRLQWGQLSGQQLDTGRTRFQIPRRRVHEDRPRPPTQPSRTLDANDRRRTRRPATHARQSQRLTQAEIFDLAEASTRSTSAVGAHRDNCEWLPPDEPLTLDG